MTTLFDESGELPAPVRYDDLASQLAGRINPAEIHGYLCGLLSAGQVPGERQWLNQLGEQMGEGGIDDVLRQLLCQLLARTQHELESGDLGAPLLLPDDDETLEFRTEALGIWCQSFISGFGQGFQGIQVSDMAEEVLRDLGEISLIEASGEGDESERLFVEVSEFVRLAWLNVYAEMHGNNGSDNVGESPVVVH